MKKSVEQQLLEFLAANPSKWSSGDLQRREWKNKNGSLATPRSIVRRLEENTYHETSTPQHKQNLQGILEVSYEGNSTFYAVKDGHEKKTETFYVKHPFEDRMITTEQYALL